jgi:D-serine dehydratase
MSCDRLKEISDYVDSVFIENEIVEKIIEDEVVKVDKVDKVIESKFVRLMRKIETRIYFKYKNDSNPDNFTMKTLYFGFIYALFRMSGYSEEMKKLIEYVLDRI